MCVLAPPMWSKMVSKFVEEGLSFCALLLLLLDMDLLMAEVCGSVKRNECGARLWRETHEQQKVKHDPDFLFIS